MQQRSAPANPGLASLRIGLVVIGTALLPTFAGSQTPQGPLPAVFAGGAELQTSPEQQRLLERAGECMSEGRADLAAVLWQKVLDEAADMLTPASIVEPIGPSSSPLVIYRPLAELAERMILAQPREALAAYRTTADAEARAILASAPPHDDSALSEVVRRFFLSSSGDEAAVSFASLALDRHDFVRAFGLLEKVLNRHPDDSVPKDELLARLAVAAAHVGDQVAAERALTDLLAVPNRRLSDETIGLIRSEVETAASRTPLEPSATARDWLLVYGNPQRTGQMPPLPPAATAGTLAEQWSQDFPLATLSPSPSSYLPGGYFALDPFDPRGDSQSRQAAAAHSKTEMIARWRAGAWRPTGGLLFAGDNVYYKAPDRMACFKAEAPAKEPVWQSAWQNRYELDATARFAAVLNMRSPDGALQKSNPRPASIAEILLFGDRVHASMTLAGGVLYSLEGKRLTTTPPRQQQRPFALTSPPRRARTNWLTAYQAIGGKALWTRSVSEEGAAEAGEAGFLAAPTPCGDHFIAPLTDGGPLWLYGLAGDSGKTLWKTYLCDEPQGGASAWAAPVLAVDGREVYVAAGSGLVFAVDGSSGAIRWALRYPRDIKPGGAMREVVGGEAPQLTETRGWDDDVLVAQGRLLLVLASDGDRLLALDRRSGERVWESPRTSPLGTEASYCLGVNSDGLYVAGKNVVRRYELTTGRLIAEQTIDGSFGRGCLTADAVYLPVGTTLVKLDLSLKQLQPAVRVVLDTDEPLGNLFSDGRRLWGVGAGRIYALTTLERRLASLDANIAAGDASAQLERMRLYLKDGRREAALSDLRAAAKRLQAELPPDEATQRLFATLTELRLPAEEPAVVLRLLLDVFPPVASPRLPTIQQRLAEAVAACVNSIRQKRPPGAVNDLLSAAPLLTEDYLQTAASFAIDAQAGPPDTVKLLQALAQGPWPAQLVALRAALRLVPAEAKPILTHLVSAADDRVRLAAARGLASVGEREGVLETLAALLSSNNAAVRAGSHQTLQALTGQRIPFAVHVPPADRAASTAAWRRWIATSGPSAKLHLPLTDRAVRLGRTLIVTPGVLMELDTDKKERWRTRLAGAAWGCQGLASGHRLVAINSHSTVVEYDASGREVWKKDRLPGPPTSVQRLENGNTLVACTGANVIVEISPDGKTTTLEVPGAPTWAERLDSGSTLVALEQPIQRVIEIDSGGRMGWEARTGGHAPVHAVRLDNGNTLVTLSKARQVVEFDPTGHSIVWRTQLPLLFPVAAQRLASGNTLVADQTGLREIDPTGKSAPWQLRVMQVMGLSAF